MMDKVFKGLSFLRVYLDDVVIFSSSLDAHVNHLLQVFQLIEMAGLKFKISKCFFAQSETRLLGHVIGDPGIRIDAEKISMIVKSTEPKNVTEFCSFLGLA